MYSHNKFTLNNNDRRNIYCTRKYYVLHKRLDNGRNVRMVCMSPYIYSGRSVIKKILCVEQLELFLLCSIFYRTNIKNLAGG